MSLPPIVDRHRRRVLDRPLASIQGDDLDRSITHKPEHHIDRHPISDSISDYLRRSKAVRAKPELRGFRGQEPVVFFYTRPPFVLVAT